VSRRGIPTILVVDDKFQDARRLAQGIGEKVANVIPRTPDTFTHTDLQSADLVLVDYELSDWDGARAGLTCPPNGLALSAVIREQVNQLPRGSVAGVALHSGKVEEIAGRLPVELRGFALARLNNLEWIFQKEDPNVTVGVLSLAHAIQHLPRPWPENTDKATLRLHQLLALDPSGDFFQTAAADVSACHPLIHELSESTHALAVIRWLAQRILPYPAFLTDTIGLAARLRLPEDQLKRLLNGSSKLATALRGVQYAGVLCDLYGPHWWRAGIDELAFRLTAGQGGLDRLQSALSGLAGRKLVFLGHEAVPAIDDSYRPHKLIAAGEALRLQPDDWPPFAGDAWASRELLAASPTLRGLVVPSDRDLLDSDA
jgi:hypothetical protein